MTELAWHWVPALQSITSACTLVSGQLAHCAPSPKHECYQQNKGSRWKKRHTNELHGVCTCSACLQRRGFQPRCPPGRGAWGPEQTPAGQRAAQPQWQERLYNLNDCASNFCSTLTLCKWALTSLAWSISNPNGSVKIGSLSGHFYIQTLGMMKAWWKDNAGENMPNFASVDMALNLYWPGKNKLSPF